MSALVATFSTPTQPRDEQGRYQGHPASGMAPARRRALLGATVEGRAVLAAQDKQATAQQEAYPRPEATDAAGRRALASLPHGQDVRASEEERTKSGPRMTPTGHVVNTMTPAAYRRMMQLTGDGREMLREHERLMHDKGIPFARSIHAVGTAPPPATGRR